MPNLFSPQNQCPLDPVTKNQQGASGLSTFFIVVIGLFALVSTLYTSHVAVRSVDTKPVHTAVLFVGLLVYWIGFALYFVHWRKCAPWTGWFLFFIGTVLSGIITGQIMLVRRDKDKDKDGIIPTIEHHSGGPLPPTPPAVAERVAGAGEKSDLKEGEEVGEEGKEKSMHM